MDYMCLGAFDEKAVGHSQQYFSERYIWLDFRGGLVIASTASFGYCVKMITASHNIQLGQFTPQMVNRPVIIDDYAWITSFCILYNCHIEHHSIVQIGSVVASVTVPPYTVVAGNPAKIIKRWQEDIKQWIPANEPLEI